MRVLGVLLLLLIAGCFFIGINAPSPDRLASGVSKNDEVISGLLAKRKECKAAFDKAKRAGVFTNLRNSAGATWADYDEVLWARLSYDDKVRQGLVIYCATMPDSGEHIVMLRGLRTGKTLGSVINGNWSD